MLHEKEEHYAADNVFFNDLFILKYNGNDKIGQLKADTNKITYR